jgi:predicted hotdog family 3-hydroxylacyl-ACP dehydratase
VPEVPSSLDRDGILMHLPHQGDSCLLDELRHWDTHSIVCESRAHLLKRNPYRIGGRLPAIIAIEVAAQAFALHACLKANATGIAGSRRHGYLASVRGLTLTVDALDECSGTLRIEAEELSAQKRGMLYAFKIQCEGTVISQGRAAVAFPSEPT